jgi:hypothetical protein
MTAGLPGTGIGGLYYLLLVALMPLRELGRALRGQGSAGSRREALRHLALAAGMVAAVGAIASGLAYGLAAGAERGWLSEPSVRVALAAGSVWSRAAAFVSAGVLACLIGGAAVLRRLVAPVARPRPAMPRREALVGTFHRTAPSLADGET